MNRLLSILSPRRWIEYRTYAMKISADGKDIPKTKTYENRVTLIGTDDSIIITDIKNAQSLSQRRELKLVKLQDADSKTRRPVYKLMTTAEYHAEELSKRKEKKEAKQNSTIKGDKLITLSTRIGEHDLMTGVRKMMKLLEKHYEVKVVITGEAEQSEASEKIFSVIEKNIKTLGKVVQKRNKGNNLRFQLIPDKQMSSSNNMLNSNQGDEKEKGVL